MNYETNLKNLVKHVVKSSNLDWIAYDEKNKNLYISFKSNKSLYIYFDVSKDIFEDLFKADSKGKFFWAKVRDKYKYQKLR